MNENNSLYEEKVYERKLRYTIYESLDQVNSKHIAVEGDVMSGIRLINDENIYACIDGKNCGKT